MSFECNNATGIVEKSKSFIEGAKNNIKEFIKTSKGKLIIMLVSLSTNAVIFLGLYKNKTNRRKVIQFL